MSKPTPFNPLDKLNLGKSVAEALLESARHPLGGIERFMGAGIYAIYYAGTFPAYEPIVGDDLPIYVGKAIPPGARQGGFGLGGDAGPALFNRLKEHADSIRASSNLDVGDFSCRYLVVEDIWIPLGESLLIANFSPIWNTFLDGFGNHDPGKGRYNQMRSRWDVVHPGRLWAIKCQERPETPEQILAELRSSLAT